VVDAVLGCAVALDPVRELDGNRGYFVDALNDSTGAPHGSPWCASFLYYVGTRALGSARWPLPRSAACDDLLRFATKNGILRATPTRGNVFLVLNPANPSDAVHTGFVELAKMGGAFSTVEGNSNDDGSREGVAVVRLQRGGDKDKRRYVFVDWESLVK
jgi:hypothetical protein